MAEIVTLFEFVRLSIDLRFCYRICYWICYWISYRICHWICYWICNRISYRICYWISYWISYRICYWICVCWFYLNVDYTISKLNLICDDVSISVCNDCVCPCNIIIALRTLIRYCIIKYKYDVTVSSSYACALLFTECKFL